LALEHGIREVERVQIFHPRFAEMELRAGVALLRLMEFDEQINGRSRSSLGKSTTSQSSSSPPSRFRLGSQTDAMTLDELQNINPNPAGDADIDNLEGTRLTREMIELCDIISSTPVSLGSTDMQKEAMRRLKIIACNPQELEIIVRSYKWAKTLCFWKYPELVHPPTAADGIYSSSPDECDFYGLKINDAKASMYIVRTLHRDIDPSLGEGPASLQASMGALRLTMGVEETLAQCQALDKLAMSKTHVAEDFVRSKPPMDTLKSPIKRVRNPYLFFC
jgi:hypothetical protein